MSFGGHISVEYFLLLLGVHSEVELLSHRISVCLALVNSAKEFLKVVLPLTLPPEGMGTPVALHPPKCLAAARLFNFS